MRTLVLAAIVIPGAAFACVCPGATEKAAFDQAQGVFRGHLRSAGAESLWSTDGLTYDFEVSSIWKGDIGQRLTVRSLGGGCAPHFDVGEEYVVHLLRGDGVWPEWVATCGLVSARTSVATSYLAELGPGRAPERATSDTIRTAGIAVLTGALFFPLWYALLRRRRAKR